VLCSFGGEPAIVPMDRRVHVQLGLLRPTVIDIEAKKPNNPRCRGTPGGTSPLNFERSKPQRIGPRARPVPT
jgi:hypothetical protein